MERLVIDGQDGRLQRKRKPKANAFSPKKRQAFLDALAFSCNVRASAEAAGVDISTAYYNRNRDSVFADQWMEAVRVGYDRLEALVLEHGGAGQALLPPDPSRAEAAALPPFDFDKALKVLAQYRRKRDGERVRGGGRPGYATRDEADAQLAKALASVAKRLGGRKVPNDDGE